MKNSISPALLRLGPAAKIAGITPEEFEKGCYSGTIPVRILKISERGRFVPSKEFDEWIKTINDKNNGTKITESAIESGKTGYDPIYHSRRNSITEKTGYARKLNGMAEDLIAAIGLSNTLLLCGTRGGETLYVPKQATPTHRLKKMLGDTAFLRMVEAYSGKTITIPELSEFERYKRIREASRLLALGKSLHHVALLTGVTYNQAKNDRQSAENLGILPITIDHNNENGV